MACVLDKPGRLFVPVRLMRPVGPVRPFILNHGKHKNQLRLEPATVEHLKQLEREPDTVEAWTS